MHHLLPSYLNNSVLPSYVDLRWHISACGQSAHLTPRNRCPPERWSGRRLRAPPPLPGPTCQGATAQTTALKRWENRRCEWCQEYHNHCDRLQNYVTSYCTASSCCATHRADRNVVLKATGTYYPFVTLRKTVNIHIWETKNRRFFVISLLKIRK